MKKFILLFLSLAEVYAYAQDCSTYYFMRNGKTIEISAFNQNGDPSGNQVYNVSNVSNSGTVTTANLATESFDKNGKSVAQSKAEIKCDAGVIMVDMKMNVPQQQQNQFSKPDAKVENAYLEYPASIKVGDQLKNGNFTIEMNTGGLIQALNIIISDRKITGQENITTPAGSWSCFKIGYTTKMTIKTGPMSMPMNIEATEWFAPSFAVIKTQSKYGSTLITAIK